jgi:hypothetical protein
VIGVAAAACSAAPVIAALAATTLISVVALGPATRTPGARLALANWRAIERFVVYSKPVVASTVIYLMINLFAAISRSNGSERRRRANWRSRPILASEFFWRSMSCRRRCCSNTR